MLFVCENNLYAMGMALERAEAETDIARRRPATDDGALPLTAWTWSQLRPAPARPPSKFGGSGAISRNTGLTGSARLNVRRAARTAQGRVEAWRKKGPIERFRAG